MLPTPGTHTHSNTHTLCISAPPPSLKESPIYPSRLDHIHQASAPHPDQSASGSAPVLLGCHFLFFFLQVDNSLRGGERKNNMEKKNHVTQPVYPQRRAQEEVNPQTQDWKEDVRFSWLSRLFYRRNRESCCQISDEENVVRHHLWQVVFKQKLRYERAKSEEMGTLSISDSACVKY